ncbi:MAG TPA: carboxypeptidase regulatory-like domain-containing protein [Verrucomicrobiae bacterium]|jgi:hypothetical protein|nr:carboxypeptidase regulatory-like domain-containing protein [Verrucomicrobiae bacterium]
MNPQWRIVWLACALVAAAQGQSPLTVGYQKIVEFTVPGATAAYSLDADIVEAAAGAGLVSVTGKHPGTTNIIVVTSAGVQSLPVLVPQPPSVFPAGFDPRSGEGSASESGSYEVRYNSDPAQVTNALTLRRIQGDSIERLQIVNANLISTSSSQPKIGFPLLSYEFGRRRWDVVLADQMVDNSPLTVEQSLVRGLHLRWGDWQFHGGITTIATFQGLFLVTDPEDTLGVSKTFHLTSNGSLLASLYWFKNPSNQTAVAPDGVVGSMTYRYKRSDKITFLSELGISRKIAYAARGTYDDKRTHAAGSFRLEPRRFPGLAIGNQHGVYADLNATRNFTPRLFSSLSLNQSHYTLPNLSQSTLSTNLLMNYKLTPHFTVSSGSAYTRFSSQIPATATIETLNLPAGIDFSTRHFGAGFQYQRTVNFDLPGGNDYAVNARGGWGAYQVTGFFRHDEQVPTLAAIFAQLPGLQDLLQRAGIVITSPDQLAQLLRDTTLLATLGFSGPLSVNITPARNDSGASFSWISPGSSHRQLNVNVFHSASQLVQGSLSFTTTTVSYSQRVGLENDVIGSAALFRTVSNGESALRPLFSITFQHRFTSVPGFILPGRHGVVQGHVFRDDESSGRYDGKQSTVGGVLVVLDGNRTTHSDDQGRYSFHHVPFGMHRVEAKFESPEPFFFTTSSPTTVDMNATADFGINFAKGQVYGFVLNDADEGVGGVTVELKGPGPAHTTQTTMDGKFSFLGLEAGRYSVSTLAASYPSGYSLQDLQPQEVTVVKGSPARTAFSVRAIRVITGKVTAYDRGLLQTVPLANMTVRLKELPRETQTGPNGAYIFRNLPTGVFTVTVEYQGKETVRAVRVPAGPANIRDVELNVGPK